ncbi:DUF3883 domain-containing protein [Streptomyces sp. BG9H]|uniref:DUF3883 domain-containing protein n=1 Tax=Streptomyces anatolicus TaxID=2675858 RepID=A0ABS6YPT5_9ACTN|nr:DUF3883 domain-containing protein [Streptomyces anatolicus]
MIHPFSSSRTFRRNPRSQQGWTWPMSALSCGTSILMSLGEGTRRAALRWLELLRIADVPRSRALFTHHPGYADLTPAQYAEGLAWLRGRGLLDNCDQPVVLVQGSENCDSTAPLTISRAKWNEEAASARRAVGMAGEAAVLEMLAMGGARRIVHVAAVSDSFGFDIDVESSEGDTAHLEVKATTDPTRLVVHLSRHEYEVMRGDGDWICAAVLVGGQGEALNLVTVDRNWLCQAAPRDQDRRGSWESARYSVPGHALVPGLVTGGGRWIIPESVSPLLPLWGVSMSRREVSASSSASAIARPTARATGGGNALPTCRQTDVFPPVNAQSGGKPCSRASWGAVNLTGS